MKEYEINDSTLAIVPTEELNSLVLEEENTYNVLSKPLEILNYSCNYFGSSYKGRKEGAKNILSSTYKLPIMVEDSRYLVFLPTSSPDEDTCMWISVNKIKDYYHDKESNKTIVEFLNGKKISVDISLKSMENQILRASRLESVIRNRKEKN